MMTREPDFVDECYAGKDLSLLKKLTLVIPTYNRNYYLSRCLWYHAHFPLGEIIVADSSPEEKKVVNRETVAKVREMFGANVRYMEYEPETEKYGGDIYRKWGDAVFKAEMEYSIICGDKMFLIPNTISDFIYYLDTNNDIDIVDGCYSHIKQQNKSKMTFNVEIPDKKLESLDYTNNLARLVQYSTSSSEMINLLALRRTKIHKQTYYQLMSENVNDLRFGEVGFELLSVIKYKSKYFPNKICSCRDTTQIGTSSVTKSLKESSSTRYPRLDEYKKLGIYYRYFTPLLKVITNELMISTDMNQLECNQLSKLLIEHICKVRGFYGDLNSTKLLNKIMNSPLRYIWDIVPQSIKYNLLIKFGLYYGSKNPNYFIKNPTLELSVLEEIIKKTAKYRKLDEPIV